MKYCILQLSFAHDLNKMQESKINNFYDLTHFRANKNDTETACNSLH